MRPHVCVAHGPGDSAEVILTHAVRLARRCDARLTVVHVVPAVDEAAGGDGTIAGELLAEREALRCRRRLLGTVLPLTSGLETDVRVFAGAPAPTLVELLRRVRPDLVIAGANERRGLARVLGSSVADVLLAEACCPVTLVRSTLPT